MASREEVLELIESFKNLHPQHVVEKAQFEQRGMNFVVKLLAKNGGTTFTFELANVMGISTARVSNLINKLEQKGFVERKIAENDARKTILILTERGKEYHEEMEEKYFMMMSKMIDVIGKEEILQFIQTFGKMQTFFESHIDNQEKEDKHD